mgnify:CR=1 FL=1
MRDLVVLSEEEKREMKDVARSAAIRAEFQNVREASQLPLSESVNLDQLVSFLSFMSRLSPPPPPRTPIHYPHARL